MSDERGDGPLPRPVSTSRASLIKFLADGISRGATPIILFPLITRYDGAGGFGAYSMALAVNSLILPFASFGVTGAVVRFFSGGSWTPDRASAAAATIKFVAARSAATAVVVSAAAPLASRLFLRGESTAVFAWAGILVFATAMEQLFIEFLRARYRLLPAALYEFVQAAAIVAFAAVALRAGFGVVGLIQVTVAVKLAALAISYTTVISPLRRIRAAVVAPTPAVHDLVRFGSPLAVAAVGLWMVNLGDRLIVGRYLGAEQSGRYGAAFLAASVLWIFSAAINLPAAPRIISAVVARDHRLLSSELRRFHHLLTVVLVPIAGLVVVVGDVALNIAAGGRFSVGTPLLLVVAAALFADQWNGLAHYVLTGLGETKFLRNAWLGAGAVNLLLSTVLVPRIGIVGAALGGLVATSCLEVSIFLRARRGAELLATYCWRSAATALGIASLSGWVAAAALNGIGGGPASLVGAMALFSCLYVGGMAVVGEIGVAEFRLLAAAFGSARVEER